MITYSFRPLSLCFILILLFSTNTFAQDELTLDDAIRIGLENNYGILMSKNQLEIAENNQSYGNAGFFPVISASATATERIEDSEFQQAGGDLRSASGARSSSKNMAIDLNWTIFDGLRMFSTYERLESIKDLSDKELQLNAEMLIAEITIAYFNVIRINEQLKILENNISVSQERIEIEETKVDLGSGSEYDLLQAQSDLNTDRAALLRETNSLVEAKILLNRLLSYSPDEDYTITSEIYIDRSLNKDNLYQKVMNDNLELAIAKIDQDISKLELQNIQRERIPEIILNTGYTFNRSENAGSFLSFNETTGFAFGVTARVTIFDGFNTNRRVQNAKINQKNTFLSYQERLLQVESDFYTIYRAYQNSVELVDLEENNFQNAEEVLDIALERFRLGTISSLEFREAQRTFLQAENRLISAMFDAKVAETELLRLSGEFGELRIQ